MREHPMSIVFSNLYGEETWDEDGAPVSDEQVNIAGPIADEFKTNNPGLFKTQVWEHGLRVVGEISVVTDYIYRLREAGLGDYIQLWGSNDWLEAYGANFPDPRIPVVEEITMFAYAYEEGMIDPEWRVFNQIDTVFVCLLNNGWDTSTMSAEDGRRYDDGELGERVVTVRGPKGYADAFRAEYRRNYPDYDTILIQKEYLPERGQPVPEGVTREWGFASANTNAILSALGYIDDAMRGENLGKLVFPPSPEGWEKLSYDDVYIIPLTTETEEGQHFLQSYQDRGYYTPVWFYPWGW